MTTVQLVLPDDLAAEAQAAGLLSEARVTAWLKEQLGGRSSAALLNAVDRMTAAAEEAGLDPSEVAEEIRVMRAEKRRPAA